nr:von Willebrand factor C domain-containing protein [Crepidula fornicata]
MAALPLGYKCSFLLFFVSQSFFSKCDEIVEFPSSLFHQIKDLKSADLDLPDWQEKQSSGNSSVTKGRCKTWMGTEVRENSSWEEKHCRLCHCDPVLGTVCTQPICDVPYHPSLENTCEQWTPDDCCCLRTSCNYNDVHYAANDWFTLTSSDPCTICKCDPDIGLPQCVERTCPKPDCVDPTSLPDQCCPLCLAGRNCQLPPLTVPKGDVITDTSPIGHLTSRVVTSKREPGTGWNCTCYTAGEQARCVSLNQPETTQVSQVKVR